MQLQLKMIRRLQFFLQRERAKQDATWARCLPSAPAADWSLQLVQHPQHSQHGDEPEENKIENKNTALNRFCPMMSKYIGVEIQCKIN